MSIDLFDDEKRRVGDLMDDKEARLPALTVSESRCFVVTFTRDADKRSVDKLWTVHFQNID